MKFRVRSSEFGVKASTMPKRMFFPNSELNDSELLYPFRIPRSEFRIHKYR